MAAAFPTLRSVVLDATDTRALAEFYRQLLGYDYRPGDEPPTDGRSDAHEADWLVLLDPAGRARLAFKDRKSLTPPALVPPLFAIWALLGWLPAIAVPEWGLLWSASMAMYLMVLCIAGLALARGKGFAVARRVPLVFAGIHFGFAWGFWREMIMSPTRQQRHNATPLAGASGSR
jgi:hypothetical protein